MPDFKVFPDTHPDVLDRAPQKSEFERPYFREGALTQASELNEFITQQDDKRTRVGNMVAQDGDRIEGCEIIPLDIVAGNYQLTAGKIYVLGDVRTIEEATLNGVTVVGDVQIGVRIVESIITHVEDPDLLGQHPGIPSEGEPGAIRVKYALAWGWSGDGESGALYAVYNLRNGGVIDQAPPPNLTGVNAQIAAYDYGAHENYIDEGCVVVALGLSGSDQIFSIGEGIANILGHKRYRTISTRHAETEAPDLETIAAEPQTYVDDSGSCVIEVNHAPINGVSSIVITKEHTETIARGGVANTADLLSMSGVTKIKTVVQGGTNYDETADWVLDGDEIDWSPAGDEPATSSSYDVNYEYLVAVTPDLVTKTHITVSGGVDGGLALVNYSFKLPRVDRICIDRSGYIVYINGISAREQPQPPITPDVLLSLCEVCNDWLGVPTIDNNGIRNYPYWQIDRLWNKMVDTVDLMSLERLRRDINSHAPTAKHEVFVDPFTSDRYRDNGVTNDAAVFDGTCQIAIDPAFEMINLPADVTLDFTDEIIIRQDFVTGCKKVNEYQAFSPVPITIQLTPSQDFWEETNQSWLSPITRVFGQGSQSRVTGAQVLESTATRQATFLRQIPIAFEISNLGVGETLDILTFDGISVDPGGLVGDLNGKINASFDIPANVTTGIKEVKATTGSGAAGSARFEGRGIITDVNRQRITDITRWNVPVAVEAGGGFGAGDAFGGGFGGDAPDPASQQFMFDEDRHVSGIDVKFCTIGDISKPVICEIVTVENGDPTRNVIAQTEVDMAAVISGAWHKFEFALPVFIPSGVLYAFVFKTDDATHSLSVATRGEYDAAKKEWVAAQPYTIGVFSSSSNAITWTHHQDTDLTMRVYGAVFDPTTKVVDLGTFAVADMSDLITTANVFLPTDQAQLRFRATAGTEPPQLIESGQNWERQSFFTGDLKLEAVLTGSTKISPVLSRDILAVPGTMRATGTYVSRLFSMGTAVRQDVRVKTKLPTGSSLTVEIDKGDNVWSEVTLAETEALANGDIDRRYTEDPWTAALGGRVKLTLTGTPASRPALFDLRSFSI